MFKLRSLVIGLYVTLGAIAIGFGTKTPDPVAPAEIVAYEVVEPVEVAVKAREVIQEVKAAVVEEHEMDSVVIVDTEPVEEVTAEPEYSLTQEEIDLIALITMAEAEGEPEEGKRLVIDTILNRVDHERFPDTVEGVIYQKSQFSSVWNGRVDRCYVQEEIVELVKEELVNRTNYEVMFFRTGDYSRYGASLFPVGNHYFSSYARKENI